MKVWRELTRISLFIIGSTVVVALIFAVIFLLFSMVVASSSNFATAVFTIVVITTTIPNTVFSVLTRYTFTKFSIQKRASFYGFCNMITTFFATVYFLSNTLRFNFDLVALAVYNIPPALICYFAWVYLAIKFLKSESLLQNGVD